MVDYHIHSTFSDGEASVEQLIDLAQDMGLDAIAITDHFDANDPSHTPKNIQQLKEHFDRIRNYAKQKKFTVYCGIETCIDPQGYFVNQQDLLVSCDLIITSPHYIPYCGKVQPGEYFNDEYWECYKQTVLKLAQCAGDVLGHPEGYLPIQPMLLPGSTYEGRKQLCRQIAERYFDINFIDQLAQALKSSGKAYELHGATQTPREWVIQRLGEQEVCFSLGSDAHAVNLLGKNEWAQKWIDQYGFRQYHPKSKER